MVHFIFSVPCCMFNISVLFDLHVFRKKINEKKQIICQEHVSFKTDLLKGLKLDSTSCKRFRTRQKVIKILFKFSFDVLQRQ